MKFLKNFKHASGAIFAALTMTLIPGRDALAQSYTIDWSTIDGGGGTSTNGAFSISGTIGQHDTGVLTNGQYSVNGGFWSLLSVVQTPGAPLLSIQSVGNGMRVYWPASAGGYVLDESPALLTGWTQVNLPYISNGFEISITVTNPIGNKFFRLRKP